MIDSVRTENKESIRGFVEVVGIIFIAVVIALVVRLFLLQLFYIPSASMDPYLKVNDKVFVNKIAYKFHDVQRGDIIVFDAPSSVKSARIKDLVKRVVGLPGETVEGKCKKNETACVVDIYVDGKKLDESYLEPNIEYRPFEEISVPANSLFVMGDNRDDSEDGRFFGPIPIDSVVGRAFFRVWPLSSFGYLE